MLGPRKHGDFWLVCAVVAASACSSASESEAPSPPPRQAGAAESAATSAPGEPVSPPFAVRGELDGLLLVWFDAEGSHTAARRSEIPEDRRGAVRIASLQAGPGQRLEADQVYVADLQRARPDGSYAVWKRPRVWFEAQVEAARGAVQLDSPAVADSSGVTLYSASWCGACRSAAAYMRSRDVPFEEKDIEKDAEANAEMLRKARAAGKSPRGVPVIDFRGNILLGYDRRALDRLIDGMR